MQFQALYSLSSNFKRSCVQDLLCPVQEWLGLKKRPRLQHQKFFRRLYRGQNTWIPRSLSDLFKVLILTEPRYNCVDIIISSQFFKISSSLRIKQVNTFIRTVVNLAMLLPFFSHPTKIHYLTGKMHASLVQGPPKRVWHKINRFWEFLHKVLHRIHFLVSIGQNPTPTIFHQIFPINNFVNKNPCHISKS